MPGRVLQDDELNEVRVITLLKNSGRHENIVWILRHGWLSGSVNVYFIDMELASFNLEEFISFRMKIRDLPVDFGGSQVANMSIIPQDCSPLQTAQNLLTVGLHIARGLEFLHFHRLVHRDLKPSNGDRSVITLL